MDTQDIRCFRLVYEERSITKAAQQLFITPQGLSRTIQRLESELSVTLFKRTKKGVEPTPGADYFYQNSGDLLLRMDDLRLGIRSHSAVRPQVHVGFSCGVLHVIPPHILPEIHQALPDYDIQWIESENEEILEQLQRGHLEVALVVGDHVALASREHYAVYPLFTCSMNAIVYQGHPLYERGSISIRDLEGETLITLNDKFYSCHALVQRCADFGFVPTIALQTMESQLIYRFCVAGMGVGIDADIHQEETLPTGLRCICIEDALPWTVSMIAGPGCPTRVSTVCCNVLMFR